MLGTGVQNWSVYTTKELMQNMRHLLSKDMYRSEKNIAQAMAIDIGQINIKATTTEKLGFAGKEEGIAAHAVALLFKTVN